MIHHTYTFNHLPAHELVPYLVTLSKEQGSLGVNDITLNTSNDSDVENNTDHAALWHICWLNNNNKPVIGLLPKTSWQVESALAQDDEKNSQVSDANTLLNIEIIRASRQVAQPPSQSPKTQAQGLENFNDIDINIKATTYTTSYDTWVKELIDYANQYSANASHDLSHPLSKISSKDLDANAEYSEGFMGYIGYDIGAKALSPNDDNIQLADQPAAFIGHYDIYLTPNTDSGWQLHAKEGAETQDIVAVKAFLDAVESKLSESLTTPALNLQPKWDFDDYADAFAKTQQFLYQGDSYQINLTQTWLGQRHPIHDSNISDKSNTADLVNYLPKLHQNTKAPFAGYLGINNCFSKYPEESSQRSIANSYSKLTFELLSCSPELFVVFHKDTHGEHHILTKPIKGTLPRGETPEQDMALKQQLADSEKDRAENVMIVDLLRNDLGRYAKTGTVQVPHLFEIESFSNVHHMVSSVTATIKEDIHPLTVLFDSLPAGSITGTPKKRAVEIIGELEAGPRGAYCGTLGFMNFDGSGQWNVLIRSLQANEAGKVELWAGGGITVASQCESEYQECIDKVGNLLKVLSE